MGRSTIVYGPDGEPGRICTVCGKWKAVGELKPAKNCALGVRGLCLTCIKAEKAEYRERNLEKCREHNREYMRRWRETHPEEARERDRRNKRKHPEREREYRRRSRERNYLCVKKWKQENKDKVREHDKKYRKNNPLKILRLSLNNRARRENIEGSCSYEELEALWFSQRECCWYCGTKLVFGNNAECEHKIPIARDGTGYIWNLAFSCTACNRSKGAKTEEEFIPELLVSSSRPLCCFVGTRIEYRDCQLDRQWNWTQEESGPSSPLLELEAG